jgi:hypothetical protein
MCSPLVSLTPPVGPLQAHQLRQQVAHLKAELAQRWATICTLQAEKHTIQLAMKMLARHLCSERAGVKSRDRTITRQKEESKDLYHICEKLLAGATRAKHDVLRLQDLQQATDARCSEAGVAKLKAFNTYLKR